MNIFESVGDNDLSRERVFTLESGFKVTIKATDPYGFWTIHFEKGQPPKYLRGNYTSFDKAKNHLDYYLRSSSYIPKKVKEVQDIKKEQDAEKRRKSGRE